MVEKLAVDGFVGRIMSYTILVNQKRELGGLSIKVDCAIFRGNGEVIVTGQVGGGIIILLQLTRALPQDHQPLDLDLLRHHAIPPVSLLLLIFLLLAPLLLLLLVLPMSSPLLLNGLVIRPFCCRSMPIMKQQSSVPLNSGKSRLIG